MDNIVKDIVNLGFLDNFPELPPQLMALIDISPNFTRLESALETIFSGLDTKMAFVGDNVHPCVNPDGILLNTGYSEVLDEDPPILGTENAPILLQYSLQTPNVNQRHYDNVYIDEYLRDGRDGKNIIQIPNRAKMPKPRKNRFTNKKIGLPRK